MLLQVQPERTHEPSRGGRALRKHATGLVQRRPVGNLYKGNSAVPPTRAAAAASTCGGKAPAANASDDRRARILLAGAAQQPNL